MKSAYLDTVFDVETPEKLPTQFVIITAYNPQGRSAPPSRNQHQDQTLRAVLIGRGFEPIRVTGRDEAQTHQEPGWAVPLELSIGIELGKMFDQLAIYQVVDDVLFLHDCASKLPKDPVNLGSWKARLR